MAKYRSINMTNFLRLSRALSDESRARILMALRGGELCLCQIIDLLGLAPSTVSKHMSVMKDAGLVEGRKEGRWHFYRLAGEGSSPEICSAIRWVEENLASDGIITSDRERLKMILRKDKVELCAHYRS
jgi:DNA-binding transcriptional ArsR family regulator